MCICIHGNMRGPSRSLDGNCILSRGSATGQRSQIERLLILRPQRPKSKNSLMMPNMVGLPALHKYGQKAFRDRGGTVLTFCQFCPALCHRFTPPLRTDTTIVLGHFVLMSLGVWIVRAPHPSPVLHSTVAEVLPSFLLFQLLQHVWRKVAGSV